MDQVHPGRRRTSSSSRPSRPLSSAGCGVDSRTYLVLNLAGSLVLAYLAWDERQWGFLLLETVWAIVSAWSLIRVSRGLPVAGAGH